MLSHIQRSQLQECKNFLSFIDEKSTNVWNRIGDYNLI